MAIQGELKIRTYYKDTDSMGLVYHANYVNFVEMARTEMLRTKGMTCGELEKLGVILPVRDVNMTYLMPAHHDEMLTVKISVNKRPTAKIEFEHEIFNEKGDLLNRGKVTVVIVNAKTMRPCHAPKEFLALFED